MPFLSNLVVSLLYCGLCTCFLIEAINVNKKKLKNIEWGSPVGTVGLALRAVNEVKLDRARLVLGWVTRLFQLDTGCGLTSCVPSLCMLCIYC